VQPDGYPPFPEPAAVLSLRECTVYRTVDEDDQPVLVVSDGVVTLSLECGLQGASHEVADAAERLAQGVHDFAVSMRDLLAHSTVAREDTELDS
jgi:hypothetical protein